MRALMCPPDYIDIEEEINVHMDKGNKPARKKSRSQWQDLVRDYMDLGVEVWFMEPQPGLQDMCFTANGGWCRWGKIILANFAYTIRQAEQSHYELWFNRYRERMLGVKIQKLPAHIRFEGQGDVVTIDADGEEKPLVLMGYGQGRTDYEAARYLAEIHGLPDEQVIPMRLIDERFYHKDMASNFIAPKRLYVFYPGAFDSAAKRIIYSSLPAELYPVTEKDAELFTCNGVFIEQEDAGDGLSVVYIASNPTQKFVDDMEARGIEVRRRGVGEFHKSGGAGRCLTLFLPEEKAVNRSS